MSCANLAILLLASACAAQNQPAKATFTFDAASVRTAQPGSVASGGCQGGPGTPDPERITCSNSFLAQIIISAWNLQFYQLVGPEWLKTDHYDIVAKIPPGTTRDRYRQMLQNLLAERFHMTAHHETKVLPIYSLVALKGGLKMAKSPAGQTGPGVSPQMAISISGQHWRLTARKQSLRNFAGWLTVQLHNPVTDDTGASGDYDFTLDFTPDVQRDDSPDLLTAIRSQLGLQIVEKKGPVDVLVIDRVQKLPTDN
jgi:uncharacterized protein (TIGR03435 family)